jgi:ligand-binding SRPBCC domain-containing protein
MNVFHHQFTVAAPLEQVAAFHASSDAFRRLVPPGMFLQIHRLDQLANQSVNEFTMWMGPVPIYWKAVHSDVTAVGFVDTQETGPMRSWVHRHTYESASDDLTRVVDHIEYQHHSGWRGVRSRILFTHFGLKLLFAWRTWATRRTVAAMFAEQD